MARGLRLHDPCIVAKYKDHLYEQIEYHKIFEKRDKLTTASEQGDWSNATTTKYQTLDHQITRIMLTAERKAGTTYTKRFEWSPALKRMVQAYRFWKLKYRHTKGLKVSMGILQRTFDESSLPQESMNTNNINHIIQEMRSAYRKMVLHRKQHRELHATYLDQLAEAIVIHRSPNLDNESARHIVEEHKLQVLKQLIKWEHMRRSYKRIKTTLSPHQRVGLCRDDIPDPKA